MKSRASGRTAKTGTEQAREGEGGRKERGQKGASKLRLEANDEDFKLWNLSLLYASARDRACTHTI